MQTKCNWRAKEELPLQFRKGTSIWRCQPLDIVAAVYRRETDRSNESGGSRPQLANQRKERLPRIRGENHRDGADF